MRARAATLGVLALWLLICLGLLFAVNRPVSAVRVQGAVVGDERREIQRVLGGVHGQRLMSLDLDALRRRVLGLTWPSEVGLRREWPTTLVVQVKRQVAVARWNEEGFLTSNGNVVQLPTPPRTLPRLQCARSEPVLALKVYEKLQSRAEREGAHISHLVENELASGPRCSANRDRKSCSARSACTSAWTVTSDCWPGCPPSSGVCVARSTSMRGTSADWRCAGGKPRSPHWRARLAARRPQRGSTGWVDKNGK